MTRHHVDPLIDAAIEETYRTHPYYAPAIARLRIIADESIPTMCTSASWVTHYNPTTLKSWTPSERAAVLVHELEHLLREHSERCGDRDPGQWNIAGDAEINQRLGGLPDGAIYPETLGMPRGRSAEVYYGATGGAKPKPQPGEGGGEGEGGEGEGQGGPGQPGKCGSAAGGPTQDHERGDAQHPGSGAADPEAARQEVAERVIGGYLPGTGEGTEIREWAEAQIGIDRAAWMTALATVIGRDTANFGAPTRWRWPGRRDPRDMGGAMLPRWVSDRPSVAVIIDTSSSITPADLDIARVAAGFLARHADVTFYSCDTDAVALGKSIPETLPGGGGTDLDVGIDLAVAEGHRAIVIVTDCGTYWAKRDPGVPVIIGANVGARGILTQGKASPFFPPDWATIIPITTNDD